MYEMKTIRVVAAVIRSENRIFATARGYGEFKGGLGGVSLKKVQNDINNKNKSFHFYKIQEI